MNGLIKSMINLIQFGKETSRLNVKLSLVLEIVRVLSGYH